MRTEAEYLFDIVEAVDAVERFIADQTEETFRLNEMIQSAVLQKLMIVGEASTRVSEPIQDKYNEIPWSDIRGFRNIAIHNYFRVSLDILWETAKVRAPEFRNKVLELLKNEFPNTSGFGPT